MMPTQKGLVGIVFLLLLSGCASARLDVTVDIYEDDARRINPISRAQEVAAVSAQTIDANEATSKTRQTLVKLIDLIALNEEANLAVSRPNQRYERGANLQNLQTRFDIQIEPVQETLAADSEALIAALAEKEPSQFKIAVADLAYVSSLSALRSIVADNLTNVAKSFKRTKSSLLRVTASPQFENLSGPKKKEVDALLNEIGAEKRALGQFVQTMREDAGLLGPSAAPTTDESDFGRLVGSQTTEAFDRSVARARPQSIQTQARHFDLLNSQIDRLQDPADAALRILVDPDNEEKWKPRIAKTTFYAEGNNSVVIVRERAGQYSVKHGVNNPSALIKGQLNISRTIARAALEFAGAAAGVPVPGGLLSAQEAQQAQGAQVPAAPSVDNQRILDEARVLQRDNARRRLLSLLANLSQEVRALGPRPASETDAAAAWDASFRRLRVRAVTLLQSQQRLFQATNATVPAAPDEPATPEPDAPAPEVDSNPIPLTPNQTER